MKVTVFNGSPKGKNSNTNIMVEEFLKGVNSARAETENIFLAEKNIHHCQGCFACWNKTPGKCIIKDDMDILIEKIKNSDIIVYACPVYVGSVTGIMKDFIDRCIPLADPHLEKGGNGIYRHKDRNNKKGRIVLISNCGFPEQYHFKFFRTVFDYLVENSNTEIIGEIFLGGGEIIKIENPFLSPVINKYKKLLQIAGKEIVEKDKISEKTKEELAKPIIPIDKYVEFANKHWDEVLSKI